MIVTHARKTGNELKRLTPDVYSTLGSLEHIIDASILERELLELLRLRVSQINGCAYCVQYHTTNGRDFGDPPAKLNLVVTWREAGIFSEREQAALAWAESVTRVADTRITDDAYAAASRAFDDRESAYLTAAIAMINVWNRLSVPYRFPSEI